MSATLYARFQVLVPTDDDQIRTVITKINVESCQQMTYDDFIDDDEDAIDLSELGFWILDARDVSITANSLVGEVYYEVEELP